MNNLFPSDAEAEVLAVLLRSQVPLYGLEIVRSSAHQITEKSIYTYLRRLVHKKLICVSGVSSAAHSGIQRPQYRLTPIGRQLASMAESLKKA
jgi:DNA-binding PadR family transcriptional regulator